MAQTRRVVVVLAALAAAISVAIPAASAATTTVRRDTAAGAAYSGNVRASLLGTATITSSLGTSTCTASTLTGSVNSDGTALAISSASFTGTGTGGACAGGANPVITAQGLPWTGGSAVFDATHAGNRDAVITIANFQVRARITVLIFNVDCFYGGNLPTNGFNRDNPNRPVPTNNQAQVRANNATINRLANSNGLCPATAQLTANFQLLGETTAGSGTFNQALYITA